MEFWVTNPHIDRRLQLFLLPRSQAVWSETDDASLAVAQGLGQRWLIFSAWRQLTDLKKEREPLSPETPLDLLDNKAVFRVVRKEGIKGFQSCTLYENRLLRSVTFVKPPSDLIKETFDFKSLIEAHLRAQFVVLPNLTRW